MNCTIRNMIKSDIESLSHGFVAPNGFSSREKSGTEFVGAE